MKIESAERFPGNKEKIQALANLELIKPEKWENFRIRYDQYTKTAWQIMSPQGRPCFSQDLMREMNEWHDIIEAKPDRYKALVLVSDIPGIFNLGGDLNLFHQLLSDKANKYENMKKLTEYAITCTNGQYRRFNTARRHNILTISLIQGMALGGGLEAALADDIIVAEKDSMLGFPEAGFKLFPGMGAHVFMQHRGVDKPIQNNLINTGNAYGEQDMQNYGIVDYIAEKGAGISSVKSLIQQIADNPKPTYAQRNKRDKNHAVDIKELQQITYTWVYRAMRLPDDQLNKINKLVRAQNLMLKRRPAASA